LNAVPCYSEAPHDSTGSDPQQSWYSCWHVRLPGTLVSAAVGIAALVAALLAVTAVRGRVHETLPDPQTLADE
jgi:hypothetical protein